MKQETKELIKWILDILYTHKIDLEISDVMPSENFDKATDFLFSLPEIESHLCRGGYIQDRNGTPCCDGDKVKFCVGEKDRNGTLLWNDKHVRFDIVEIFSTEVIEDEDIYSVRNVIWFEKVKE